MCDVANKEYRVRIPKYARAKYGGKTREIQRFEDPAAGETWVADIKADLKRIRIGGERRSVAPPARKSKTLGLMADAWLGASDAAESTKSWYRTMLDKHIIPRLGLVPLLELGKARMKSLMRQMAEEPPPGSKEGTPPSSPDTIKKVRGIIVMVLKWARGEGYAIDSTALDAPVPKVQPQTLRRYDPDTMAKILKAASAADRVILEVALETGFRDGELRAFRIEWIRWADRRIVVEATTEYVPKSRRPRSVPLSQHIEKILRRWIDGRTEGLVFPPRRQGQCGAGKAEAVYLRGVIRRVRAASGIYIRGVHDLRHHYLSHLAALGVVITEVQAVAGHKDLATTQKYMHAAPDHLERSRSALDRARRGRTRAQGGRKPARQEVDAPLGADLGAEAPKDAGK